ncbi:MAG: 16S rRNA (adenine(1518)-N(6)/adenine(1519)-N(6))-dimethyltransferase RsmA [Flavobacteriales bacterium]|nr:16S rRNA (adenine(1518)-N(6)/adenine(1519)-N(6))-dimethyltransferase RsmA [Flavobacteriales bacterium]MCL4856725.1 16S rRNA (adenine(1518)-N(6)/adenine(1519)-N(6))-dimethyltransferase RsmA [Flavobacteriales bacterium]
MKFKKHNRNQNLEKSSFNTTRDERAKDDVKAKKHLGQHFLTDLSIAKQIVDALTQHEGYNHVLEIGPGMGVLTQYLKDDTRFTTHAIDVDFESITYLKNHFPTLEKNILYGDFLQMDLGLITNNKPFAVIGNFPYNISTEILFKVLDNRNMIPEVVGMFQKEVAERVAAKPGSKTYGITSVLLQAFYTIEYLFTVHENVFNPPPKVKSGVIRLTRNNTQTLNCSESFFKTVVKTAFNQRRKMLSNSLKPYITDEIKTHEVFNLRPEQLSVEQFVELTNMLEEAKS